MSSEIPKCVIVKKEVLNILKAFPGESSSKIMSELSKTVKGLPKGSLRVYLAEMCKDKQLTRDKSSWPVKYHITGSPSEKFVRTQSLIFPEFMVAVRRKGKEFRHPFKTEKDLGAFLDRLSIEDEVAIYKKAECKKEVKAVWKLS